ncbi:MAG: hypothetical protein JWP31_2634 [Aeromicrobium sp.]|nr:hypothetical protein [Aeromicrobium sp.]
MSEHLERFRRRADTFERLVAAVPADRWSSASPCEEWDARAVVGHVIDMLGVMLRPLDRELTRTSLDDPLAAFRGARADVEPLLADPVVAKVETTSPAGVMPFEQLGDLFGGDMVWHGWDLAKATGLDSTIDPDEVAAALPSARQTPPEMYVPDAFGPGVVVFGPKIEVDDDVSDEALLLALMGRDIDWRAPA